MNPVHFDEVAQSIIVRRLAKRPDAALRLRIQHTAGCGGAYSFVTLRWTTRGGAAHDTSLIHWHGPDGVPIFVVPRLWRYLTWHPLRVDGLRFGPLRILIPATNPLYLHDLCAWECMHPAEEPAARGVA